MEEESSKKKNKDNGYIWDATLDTLKILKKHKISTTFFITGEIFKWYPDLIDNIKKDGHEIGYHTFSHRKLLNKKILIEELEKGKEFIDQYDIIGFRAPEMYMKKDYCNILKDWGFSYDSSIYSPFKIFEPIDGLKEIPVSTYPIIKTKKPLQFPRILTPSLILKEIPFGSGYFIGFFGSNIQWFIKQVHKKNNPAIFFIHTWQIKNPPKINNNLKGSLFNKIRMIPYNINRYDTFDSLCKNYSITPIKEFIKNY